MTNINFLTPVSFGNRAEALSQSFLEFADDYFFFGGDKAVVQFEYVDGESQGVDLVYVDFSWVSIALKVISYCTIIIPVVLWTAKCILRSIHHFHWLPPLTNGLILKRHGHLVIEEILKAPHFPPVLAELIASYVTSKEDCFGVGDWQRYFEANIVDLEPVLSPYEFYRFWFSRDPIYPTKLVCDTHFLPVLCPQNIMLNGTLLSYNLNTLGQLMSRPREGYSSRYKYHNSEELETFRLHAQTQAGPTCWIIMRKDLLARGESYSTQIQVLKNLNTRTGISYQHESSAIEIATVVSVHHVVTGEYYLGNAVYAAVKEGIRYGFGPDSQMIVGSHDPRGLHIKACSTYPGFDYSNITGIIPLKKLAPTIVL